MTLEREVFAKKQHQVTPAHNISIIVSYWPTLIHWLIFLLTSAPCHQYTGFQHGLQWIQRRNLFHGWNKR
jgi:hypothetical protein